MLKGKYFLFVSFSDNDIFLWKFMRVINSIRLNLTFQHPWYLFIYSVKWLSYQVHNIIYQQVYLYLTYEMRHSSKYKNNISSYHLDYTYTCSIDKVRGGGGLGGWVVVIIHLFTYLFQKQQQHLPLQNLYSDFEVVEKYIFLAFFFSVYSNTYENYHFIRS